MIRFDPHKMVRTPTHPGEILADCLKEMGISQVELAAHLHIRPQRVNEIIQGKRGISAETAWLLAQAFRTTPQHWLNLQGNYDLAVTKRRQVAPIRPAA